MVGHMLHTLNAQSQDFGDQLKVDRDSVGDKQEVLDTSQIKFLQAKSVGGTIANSGDMNMIALMQEEKKYQELCAKLKVNMLLRTTLLLD